MKVRKLLTTSRIKVYLVTLAAGEVMKLPHCVVGNTMTPPQDMNIQFEVEFHSKLDKALEAALT